MSDSNAASSAQTLLDALLELRRLGSAGVFSDSGRFRAFMSDLRPGLKKEVRVLSALIDAGYLQRLQDADDSGRVIIAGQLRLWLAEELELNTERVQSYSSVLMAFYNGETAVSSAGSMSGQYGLGATSANQHLSPTVPPSHSSGSSGSSADECIGKGARLYAKGQYREAADWYRKAAEQGDADAQYMLGNMYRDGVGVESDWDVAVDWYCRAAVQSHAEAKQALTLQSVPKSAPMPRVKPVPQSSLKPSAPKPVPQPKLVVPVPPRPNAVPNPAVSPKKSALALRNVYADKRVGDRFEFGHYPQGKNGEVGPVKWRVVRQEKDYLLVIAERGLDCKKYHETLSEITWADCSLRRWLNSEFYEMAFNEQERECVLKTSISNNACPVTEDRVFLLSIGEVNRFADDNARLAKPTSFAAKNGAYKGANGCSRWWLRSRGCSGSHAAYVYRGGSVNVRGSSVYCDSYAVRPALKLAI